ncbi:MAG: hypothetical protein WD100_03030 [Tistlia sp.]
MDSSEFDPFIHPPLKAEQRERLRAAGEMGPEDREMTFGQFLDVINPLQHIPVVGPIYRAVTGDTLDSSAAVVGSLIYGGPVGLVAGLVGAVVQQASGRDIGGLALAMISGGDGSAPIAADTAARGSAAGATTPDQTAAATTPPTDGGLAQRATSAPALPAGTEAPAVQAAARQAVTQPGPPAEAGRGAVLTGADALSGLANDVRSAVSQSGAQAGGSPTPAQAEADQGLQEEDRAALAGVPAASGGRVPPRESFMPLSPRDFSGPAIASQVSTEHAADTSPLPPRQPGIYPASLSRAAIRREAASLEPGEADAAGASLVETSQVAPGLRADPRFAGGIAPQANFTDRMMEALGKYQALSGQGGGGTAAN